MGFGVGHVETIKTDDFKKLKAIAETIEFTKVYNGRYVKSYEVKPTIYDDFYEMTIILYDY